MSLSDRELQRLQKPKGYKHGMLEGHNIIFEEELISAVASKQLQNKYINVKEDAEKKKKKSAWSVQVAN